MHASSGPPTERRFIFVAIEVDAPIAIATYEYGDVERQEGDEQLDELLNLWHECASSGRWPGYPDRVSSLWLPKRYYEER